MSDNINSFLSLDSLTSYGGASLAVFVLTSTVRKLSRLQSPWVPFVFAQTTAMIGAATMHTIGSIGGIFIAVLNGCLLFCSALGMNEAAVTAIHPVPPGTTKLHGAKPGKWFSSWYRR